MGTKITPPYALDAHNYNAIFQMSSQGILYLQTGASL